MFARNLNAQLYALNVDDIRTAVEDFFGIRMKDKHLVYFDLEDTIWKHRGYLKSIANIFFKLPSKTDYLNREMVRLVKGYKRMPIEERIDLTAKVFEGTPLVYLEKFGDYLAGQISPFSSRFLEALYGLQTLMMSFDIKEFAKPTKNKLEAAGIKVDSSILNAVVLDDELKTTTQLYSVAEGVKNWDGQTLKWPESKKKGLEVVMREAGTKPKELVIFNDKHPGESAVDGLRKEGATVIKGKEAETILRRLVKAKAKSR
jgi:hypothetical protein